MTKVKSLMELMRPAMQSSAPLTETDGPRLENGKPVVLYSVVGPFVGADPPYEVEIGRQCVLTPVDHPNERLNAHIVFTSAVQGANADTGIIETLNTVYKPHPSVKKPYFRLT